jgi:hypothetical protein
MRIVVPLLLCGVAVSSSSAADPLRPVVSVDTGPAVALDGRLGGVLAGRIIAEHELADRVALGLGFDGGVARWWDVGTSTTGDLIGVQLLGEAHVAIRLTRDLEIEPAVALGALHLGGDRVGGWVPAYGSTVAVVHRTVRAGVRSRIAIGGLDAFEPGTELSLFVGWQS